MFAAPRPALERNVKQQQQHFTTSTGETPDELEGYTAFNAEVWQERAESETAVSYDTRNSATGPPPGLNPHAAAARGLTRLFGLHPFVATALVIVDVMVSRVSPD